MVSSGTDIKTFLAVEPLTWSIVRLFMAEDAAAQWSQRPSIEVPLLHVKGDVLEANAHIVGSGVAMLVQ